ncbi:cell envelope biogenesis protein TolA [Stakelama saccharophila]|uniref:Cell envelope biogenesis protein TolA n=1 Tax=Stakelama saccharophila TaxID=3075605 RepID=A0ABZ0BB58_9SPHN|nr:cell envelope biogenesis protein TolA [Stakelama sp. W311]WNO54614.1 cell envelope biogenesis protein TolA [Stakelama sp. W311]
MMRGDKAALGVAVAAHVVLFGLLSVGFLSTPNPLNLESKPLDVSLVDEIALESAAPVATEDPAASLAPEIGDPSDAPAPADAAADLAPATPQPEAEPEPAPKPAESEKPAPKKPAPEKPAKKEPAKRETGKRAEAKPEPKKAQGSDKSSDKRARGSRLGDDFLKGITDTGTGKGETPRAEKIGSAVVANLADAIRRQVQPCANRVTNPGPGANEIVTKLRIRMNPDGSLAARPELRGQTGVGGENRRYARRVAELATSAFIACAPYNLPKQYYEGGWEDIILTYKLPG